MTGPLKTWLVAAIAVAVLLVAGLPALAVALASDDGPSDRAGHAEQHGKVEKRDRDGGPTWAHGQGRANGPGSAWRSLTPTQKAKKMAELSREHADAMQKWADCVTAGKDDCVRPVPPGLAKRR